MMARLIEKTESFADITVATYGEVYEVGDATSIFIQVDATETNANSASVSLQKSNDGITFTTEDTANITQDGTVWLEDLQPHYRCFRIAFAITSGEIDTAECHILVKG